MDQIKKSIERQKKLLEVNDKFRTMEGRKQDKRDGELSRLKELAKIEDVSVRAQERLNKMRLDLQGELRKANDQEKNKMNSIK